MSPLNNRIFGKKSLFFVVLALPFCRFLSAVPPTCARDSRSVPNVPAPRPRPAFLGKRRAGLFGKAGREIRYFALGIMEEFATTHVKEEGDNLCKTQLGDIWTKSEEENNSTSVTSRSIVESFRSIDLPIDRNGDDSGSAGTNKVRVCFRNLTPDDITLCWMSNRGKPYHFYKLKPLVNNTEGENKDNMDLEDDEYDVETVMDGHTETTMLGHAFLLARRTCNHEKGPDKKSNNGLRGSKKDETAGFGNEKIASNPDGRHLTASEVIGGYRPTALWCRNNSNQNQEADSFEHRVHVVTITKRELSTGHLRGSSEADVCEYDITVVAGKLDPMPIDTSDKAYRDIELGGWPVRCEETLWKEDDEATDGASELDLIEESRLKEMIANDLAAASRRLPRAARDFLKQHTPIYINRSQKYGPKCAPVNAKDCCFHPGKDWLIRNGMSPIKEGCVEMYRVKEYRKDRHLWGEGGVFLHELSHAYHHKCLKDGYDNAKVRETYESAMKKGLYDKVCVHTIDGREECRAYACTNEFEYFAELSTAFLGCADGTNEFNKWYPFNRLQIKEHDPDGYLLLKRAWKIDDAERNKRRTSNKKKSKREQKRRQRKRRK